MIDVRVTDFFGGVEGEPACEDGQLCEEIARRLVEQVITPGDRRPQRPLTLRCVASSAREDRERVVEPLQQRLRSEELRPSGGQLDCERKPVQPAADGRDRLVLLEVAPDRACALDEERFRIERGERIERILALDRQVEWASARCEHAQPARPCQQRADARSGGQEVLEVVEE